MGIRQESASGSAPQVIDGTDLIGVKTPNASLIYIWYSVMGDDLVPGLAH
jgi:hypothetical protein